MPRKPDPELKNRIVDAAMRLLDRGGKEAVTVRSVALEVRTTTPTIYERFPGRDVLMHSVVHRGERELLAVLQPVNSVDKMCREFLRFICVHPWRLNLSVETFGARLVGGDPTPLFDLLKSRLTKEVGVTGKRCKDLAFAIASLFIGTATAMIAVGCETHQASELRRTSMSALQHLLKAFSDPQAEWRPTLK
jgi:AcrR family transcriptional regulator